MIFNRNRIPPLPRGMLASRYDPLEMTAEERRVLARLGARDPMGIKLAMKRANVTTINELVAHLEHHQPKRNAEDRLLRSLGKARGGTPYHPHQRAVLAGARQSKQMRDSKEIEARVKRNRKAFEETNR